MAGAVADVLLVGLGNIGFRHLQGMGSVADRIRLWAVDPAEPARERAAAEWARLGGTMGGIAADPAALPGSFATAVLATPARGRLELLRAVLPRITGAGLVLEKVAFLSVAEMRAAGDALDAAGKRGWVNCARRLWPLHARMKAQLGGRRIAIEVRGRDLGLGSNGVHFLDLLQHLAGEDALETAGFEPRGVMEAKRAGYFESRGVLRARTPGGSTIAISVTEEDPAATEITLRSDLGAWRIEEMKGLVDGPGGWQGERAPYQSELTGVVVAGILEGRCDLSPFAASLSAHRVLLDALGPQMAAAGVDISAGVPIT